MAKPRCPRCGSDSTVRIVYGMPVYATFEAAQRGEVALGGCVVQPGQPTRACKSCGARFRGPDAAAWPDTGDSGDEE